MQVSYVLGVREILALLKEEKVLADLKSGARGAPKMSGEQLAQLQQFGEIVNPLNELRDKSSSFSKQVNISAEHFLHLAEMKVSHGTFYIPLPLPCYLEQVCGWHYIPGSEQSHLQHQRVGIP